MPENGNSPKRPRRAGKLPHEEAETRLAASLYLARALSCLDMPIRMAEDWVRPADLLEFLEEIDKRVREFLGFIDAYLEKHPRVLRQADNRQRAWIVESELADARKHLDLLDKLRAARIRSATGFSAEAEELRKLRSGELKIKMPSASKDSARA
jgi:hypothetical protein